MTQNNKNKGEWGEDIATEFLMRKGYSIIERNYRYGNGEIDIIARDKDILVFVEVKSRHSLKFGHPLEGISKSKVSQIKKIAFSYLYDKEITDIQCRFDVIGILKPQGGKAEITHLENAFQ